MGPHGRVNLSPNELRRSIIESFFARWRKEVGDDIYPALRLILPEKDRDRAMYGLKEKTIGKLLVKTMKIDKNSEDGFNLINWKLPGRSTASRMAGDFAGRCFEVLQKRPILTAVGDMLIEEVNDLLDRLALAPKEADQLPLFEEFYRRMNPEELMWLIRIILRQMKVGATERTFFGIWHPDAEGLFNVSSSLRRVCWELHDPSVRLEGEERGVSLMQCFQPQLAQFQMYSFEKMVERLRPTPDDPTFWVEEKLDGERMQLHMMDDSSLPGGKRFGFWSRKAKDYTYLYGESFQDQSAALTRHLTDAFDTDVRNLILDGEMITWDPEQDAPVPFGTLKTAALAEQRNPFSTGPRPLFRVFDILLLNDAPLTAYTLRDRRLALERCIRPIHRRLEVHAYTVARHVSEIEPILRQVIAEASEGLVLKNPRSPYRLNQRNDDWMKVKPEYMTEFGESLDCVVIGGYYGSGNRGGQLASFLCGLRVDSPGGGGGGGGAAPEAMKCYSFFKVGGGFTAADYASVRHATDGKWHDWDRRNPPTAYMELAGGDLQYERPDQWIRPDESVVLSVKAAQVTTSDSFRMGLTLRFPRFKRLRTDRDWTSALSIQEFLELKSNVEKEHKEKELAIDDGRRKRPRLSRKRSLVIVGTHTSLPAMTNEENTGVFAGLNFFILTDATATIRKSKAELEQLVKRHGGSFFQTDSAVINTLCIADKRTVKTASLQKRATTDIVRSTWVFDCIAQAKRDMQDGKPPMLLPTEPAHMFFTTEASQEKIRMTVDQYGDSYARDVESDELKALFASMPPPQEEGFDARAFRSQLAEHGADLGGCKGWLFDGVVAFIALPVVDVVGDKRECEQQTRLRMASLTLRFAGGELVGDLSDERVTHVVVGENQEGVRDVRNVISRYVCASYSCCARG